jgi:hypothetical protein
MQYLTTKTVAYIFALVIDCVTVFHQDSPHSRPLQHEASILKELDSMPPDDFRTELRDSFTDFYENILKKACAGGRPLVPQVSASLPAPEPPAGAAGDDNNVVVPRADSDAAVPPPGPAAACGPPRSGGATDASPGAACRQRPGRWQAQDFLIETCLSLHYCD